MSKYDFFFIVSGNQTEEELGGVLDQVKSHLEAGGAQAVSFEAMGKQKLAYAIGQDRFGYFINSTFELEPAKAAAVGEKLKQQPEVIRYLISKLKPGQTPGKYTVKTVPGAAERFEGRFPVRKEARYAALSPAPEQPKAKPLSPEELEKKLEEILKESPNI